MIERLRLYESRGFDPYRNLAVEQHLLETTPEGCCTLYLWQNENTVVIGRNQNAWQECRTTLLEQENGRLARRLSGGGAVFHDLGNLNFTFLLSTADYDLERQLEVVRRACRTLGVRVEKSGRNDLLAEGRKFSGNAFYHHEGRSYHHGTLLVDVDMDKLGRYLNPSKAKLRAKGVESARARVVNLRELSPGLSVEALRRAMCQAFGETYGLCVEPLGDDALNADAVETLRRRNESWGWNYGQRLPFDFSCEERFDWGVVRLELAVEYGAVRRAAVYSDAMDWTLAPRLSALLEGCRFTLRELTERLEKSGDACAPDVCAMLARQNI
ncbi:MAG: lipoate--protein ligase [Oscillospiraceae bacterium]|nr:lipoate--protein ligase [Oscillospiraceae bacterium]